MTFLHPDQDSADDTARKRLLIEVPTLTRRLYRRSGFAGLEANTLQVLIAVELAPRRTVGELVEELALAQSTVSTALTRLQERGFVVADNDRDDARRQLQQITPRGRQLVNEFLAEVSAHFERG
jgi:DNA-binding MarR family transcriptional regulator